MYCKKIYFTVISYNNLYHNTRSDILEKLSKSLEDYLETIFLLQTEKQEARSKDIAERLNVKKSSVTNALQHLSEKGFVNYDRYSVAVLTDEGKLYAEDIYRKHTVMKKFLMEVLNVDADNAEQNACRIEHVIDKDIFSKFSCFLDYIINSDNRCVDIEKFKSEYCKG